MFCKLVKLFVLSSPQLRAAAMSTGRNLSGKTIDNATSADEMILEDEDLKCTIIIVRGRERCAECEHTAHRHYHLANSILRPKNKFFIQRQTSGDNLVMVIC